MLEVEIQKRTLDSHLGVTKVEESRKSFPGFFFSPFLSPFRSLWKDPLERKETLEVAKLIQTMI